MIGRTSPYGNAADYPSASDLAAALAQCRADWLPRYFPAGRLRVGVFELGDADGGAGRSFPIPLTGHARLVDFAGGFAGDDLALLARAIGKGDDMAAACREARAFLGITGKTTAPRRPPPPEPAPDLRAERTRELAQELWRQAHPLCHCEACEPGRRYLTSRGITSWPEAIFFHPACPSRDVGTGPAILAPVNDARTGLVVGVWRIRITDAGEKLGRFALGPTKANCSRLYWPDGDELAIAEGVEDSVAFCLLTGMPCWAALSSNFMADLILPARFRRVVIVQDNDPPHHRTGHRPGPEAAQRLARRLRSEGREVRIIASDIGKDPNDALLARVA